MGPTISTRGACAIAGPAPAASSPRVASPTATRSLRPPPVRRFTCAHMVSLRTNLVVLIVRLRPLVLVVPWLARTAIGSRTASDVATTRRASPLLVAKVSDGIEHHHPGGGAATFLLLGRVDPMRPDVDGQAMNLPLHREVLELAEVLGVVLLED